MSLSCSRRVGWWYSEDADEVGKALLDEGPGLDDEKQRKPKNLSP